MNKRIFIRVDANAQIGYGHLTRCLSLAQELDDFERIVASKSPLKNIIEVQDFPCRFLPIEDESDFLNTLNTSDWVLVDGYHFDSSYFSQLKAKGVKILVIDDLAEIFYPVDLIINTAPLANSESYKAAIYTQFCLGLSHALLRPDFLKIAQESELNKVKNSVFICFGGSDPLNKTEFALQAAIDSQQFDSIQVVLGPGYQFEKSLRAQFSNYEFVTFFNDLNASKMASLMSKSRIGIVPCSGILLEAVACKMKIISGYYVENQKQVYQDHLSIRTFVDGKEFSYEALRTAIAQLEHFEQAESLIDGNSMTRLKKTIERIAIESSLGLRKATKEDEMTTFEWANNKEIRANSFSTEPIPLNNHISWFSNKISDSSCLYLILHEENEPIGSIRFDIQETVAKISYLIDPRHFNKGYGNVLMKMGLKELATRFTIREISEVHGDVFPNNVASIRTFERFGFQAHQRNNVLLFTKKFIADV